MLHDAKVKEINSVSTREKLIFLYAFFPAFLKHKIFLLAHIMMHIKDSLKHKKRECLKQLASCSSWAWQGELCCAPRVLSCASSNDKLKHHVGLLSLAVTALGMALTWRYRNARQIDIHKSLAYRTLSRSGACDKLKRCVTCAVIGAVSVRTKANSYKTSMAVKKVRPAFVQLSLEA